MINRKIFFLPSPSSHYQPPPFFRLVSTASSSFLTSLQLLSHTILLSHLESSIITGTLLSWQRSYLTNRQQFVFVLPPQPLYLKVYPRVRCSAPFYSPFTCFPLVVSRPVLLSPTLLTSSSYSALPLLRWWHPALHLYQIHYCWNSFCSWAPCQSNHQTHFPSVL